MNRDKDIVYIQFRSNRGSGIKAFLKSTRQKMDSHKYKVIMVDMRKNGGGDFQITYDFFKNLGKHLVKNGKIYILTSEVTFSAGIVGVAFLKHFWKDKVIIIGDRIGDREQFWAESRRFQLPNSQMKMTYSDAMHDLKNPESFNHKHYYHWYKENINPVVGSLDPDIHVVTTFEDYISKRDPVLEKISELEQVQNLSENR